jgi:hypothetical protein
VAALVLQSGVRFDAAAFWLALERLPRYAAPLFLHP